MSETNERPGSTGSPAKGAEPSQKEWLKKPRPMEIVVRIMPGVYTPVKLPAEIVAPEDAVEYARNRARRMARKLCLVLSRDERNLSADFTD